MCQIIHSSGEPTANLWLKKDSLCQNVSKFNCFFKYEQAVDEKFDLWTFRKYFFLENIIVTLSLVYLKMCTNIVQQYIHTCIDRRKTK